MVKNQQVMSPASGDKNGTTNESSLVSHIPKLTKDNYMDWSWALKIALSSKSVGVWEYISDEVSDSDYALLQANLETFIEQNLKALRLLMFTVSTADYPSLKCGNAREAWCGLKNKYLRDNVGNKATLATKLCNMDMDTFGSLQEYHASFMSVVEKLNNLDTKLVDLYGCMFLRGVSPRLGHVVSMIAQSDRDLNIDKIVSRLETEEELLIKKTPTDLAVVDQARFKRSGSAKYGPDQCRYCKKTGHWARDCPTLQGRDEKKGAANAVTADGTFNLGNVWVCGRASQRTSNWFFDSGASQHICNDAAVLSNFAPLSNAYVTTADGGRAAVQGRGNLTLELPMGSSNSIRRILKNVLFVPTMLKNLLSCHRLAAENGVETCTGQNVLTLNLLDGSTVRAGEWDKSSELYRFTGAIVGPSSGKINAVGSSISDTLHKRLAHIPKETIASYIQEGLVENVPDAAELCSSCATGKSHRLPYNLSTTQTKAPGDILHSDVMGPFEVASRGNANYVCTLIDDFSGYTLLGLLQRKSNVEQYIRTQIAWLNNQSSGTRVKILRSDNGGEYLNNSLDSFLKNLGITHQTSAPYTPQQNGLAERKNRTLIQDTVTLLNAAGLSKEFWGAAMSFANHVRNRLPNKRSGKHVSPYEVFTGVRPTLDHIRIFGCTAWVNLVKERRPGKLNARAKKGVMIGFSETSKAYRIFCPADGRVYVSRDVVFDESNMASSWMNKSESSEATPAVDLSGGYVPILLSPSTNTPTTPQASDIEMTDVENEMSLDDTVSESSTDHLILGKMTTTNSEITHRPHGAVTLETMDLDEYSSDDLLQAPKDNQQIRGDDIELLREREESEENNQVVNRRSMDLQEERKRLEEERVILAKEKESLQKEREKIEERRQKDIMIREKEEIENQRRRIETEKENLRREREKMQQEANRLSRWQMEDETTPIVEEAHSISESSRGSSDVSIEDQKQIEASRNHDNHDTSLILATDTKIQQKRAHESESSSQDASISGNDDDYMSLDEEDNQLQLVARISEDHRMDKPPRKAGRTSLATVTTFSPEPKTFTGAQKSEEWPHWKKACEEELKSLKDNHVWELTELPLGKRVITSKWVFARKFNGDGTLNRYKARLVARGFTQREGEDFDEIFAPTVHFESVRTVIALAVQKDYEIHQMDVKTAFLYGKLEEEIYLAQPPGYEEGRDKVWRLRRSLYGLRQAPRCWNKVLKDFLTMNGFEQSKEDYGIFKRANKDNELLVIVVYVDDILIIANTKEILNKFKGMMKSQFKMTDMGEAGYFLGMSTKRDRKAGTLLLNQPKYISDVLQKFNMLECNSTRTPIDPNWQTKDYENDGKDWNNGLVPYQNAVGCLIYLVTCTRPDIA